MVLSFQSFQQWVAQQAAAAQSSATAVLKLAPGAALRAILEANASVALWMQWLISLVMLVTRAATSTGLDLDSWLADFGFARIAATYATGSVTFGRYVESAAAFVPVGTTVKTSDGTQQFAVTANAASAFYSATLGGYTIPVGQASAVFPVQALNAGTQGNVAAGTIALSTAALAFIDTVTNAAAFTNGIDAQTDAAARSAFVGFINTRSSATKAAIAFAVQQVQQNLTWSVAENSTAGGVFTPGTFTVWVDDGSGAPPSGLLSTVYAAIDAIRPIGSSFSVLPPSVVNASVSFNLVAAPGYTVPALDTLASLAVSAYVGSLPMGAALPYNKLAQVIFNASPGIANIANLTINGAKADIGGAQSQVVRVASVGAG